MKSQSFNQNGPKAFFLATDGQFTPYRPENDHVWALILDSSEAYPFHLYTTFGLRARSMRFFPNFILGNQRHTKATDFKHPPAVTHFTPASLRIACCLKNGVTIQFECLMPQTDILVGNLEINNPGHDLINLTIEMAAILVPMDKGIPSQPEKEGLNQIIVGHTKQLWPVLFMTGGPDAISNPYPTLRLPVQVEHACSYTATWSLVTKFTRESSLETAKQIIASNWQKTYQTHTMKHASQTIDIQTGNPDWDKVLLLSQRNAMIHLVNTDPDPSTPCFLKLRNPDQPAHTGQAPEHLTTLEMTHLAQVLLPAHADIISTLVENALTRMTQKDQPKSRITQPMNKLSHQECPLISNLCLEIYEINPDIEFLTRVYPDLCKMMYSWFNPIEDPKHQSHLVWQSPQQCQLDTGMFAFDIWEKTGRGLDIRYAESPALLAMLHREATALRKIAEILADKPGQKELARLEKILQKKFQAFWSDELKTFTYLDRQSHQAPSREISRTGSVQENLAIKHAFNQPQRLQLHLTTDDERSRVCSVHFSGQDSEGENISETFAPTHIRWVMGRAHLTTHNRYGTLFSVSFEGMKPEDHYCLETADYSQADITCLLPVGSGAASQEQHESILKNHLDWQDAKLQYGIPETWKCIQNLPEDLPIRVNVLWNTMIIAELVRGGYSQQAMSLFTNLMSTMIEALKDYGGFYPCFDNKNGKPVGQRNNITGLAPVRLFLQIAGIRLFTPTRLAVWGKNPFPWPIHIQWQGLSLHREGAFTHVIFPDGSSYQDEREEPVLLTQGGETPDHD